MKFAKVIDGTIISGTFGQLWPNRHANDEISYAMGNGFLPVSSNLPYDQMFEQLVDADVYFKTGTFYDVVAADADLDTVKSKLHDIVAAERETQETSGIPYAFTADDHGTIQTRNDTDIRNVQAQVLAAIILQAQNVTDPVMTFRDAENVTHDLTPTQMITMGMTVSATISSFYGSKWTKDDAINNLASVAAAKTWLGAN